MLLICEALATLSAALFAGAAVYLSFVEHPARIFCGTRLAVTECAPSYKRATLMQSLAAVGSLSAIAAWLGRAPTIWLLGALLLGAVIPFTILVILPTNRQLLHPSLDKDSELAHQPLRRWGKLHAVRSCLSLASFPLFLYSAFWH